MYLTVVKKLYLCIYLVLDRYVGRAMYLTVVKKLYLCIYLVLDRNVGGAVYPTVVLRHVRLDTLEITAETQKMI
jgi:hypothetical protein